MRNSADMVRPRISHRCGDENLNVSPTPAPTMRNTNGDTGPLQRSSLMALRPNFGPSYRAVGDTDRDAV